MQTFKRGPISLISSLVVAIVTGAVLYFVIGIFTDNPWIYMGISGAIFLLLLHGAFFSENIRFEVEGSEFRYYQKGKLKDTVELTKAMIGYDIKTTNGSADYIYLLMNVDNVEQKSIDATSIGLTKFYKMYDVLKQYAKEKGDKLEVKPKDGKTSTKIEVKKKQDDVIEDKVEKKNGLEFSESNVDPIKEK